MDLQAASMGLDAIKDKVAKSSDESELADIYLSAGFDLFFDKNLMGKYMDKGVFKNISRFEHINPAFENEVIDLRDPLGRYSIMKGILLFGSLRLQARSDPCLKSFELLQYRILPAPNFSTEVKEWFPNNYG